MKENDAPEKIYVPTAGDELHYHMTCPNNDFQESIEYIRVDAFIEKAAEFLYNYNQKQFLKHRARATLGYGEYTINVDEFRKYMKGE